MSKQTDRARLVIEVVGRENNDNGKQAAALSGIPTVISKQHIVVGGGGTVLP